MSGKCHRNRNRKIEIKPSMAEVIEQALNTPFPGFDLQHYATRIMEQGFIPPLRFVSPQEYRRLLAKANEG